VNTIKRVNLPHIPHFSAHSKYNERNGIIETIDYDVFTNTISYFELARNLTTIRQNYIKLNYLPIVHDFWSTDKSLILFDSPLSIEAAALFSSPMPVKLRPSQKQ